METVFNVGDEVISYDGLYGKVNKIKKEGLHIFYHVKLNNGIVEAFMETEISLVSKDDSGT